MESAWIVLWLLAPDSPANILLSFKPFYESTQTTPDDLLLFFHHVPYTYVLHSGKTVIQHVYDSHYDGADEVQAFVREWKTLQPFVDTQRYTEVLAKLEYQAGPRHRLEGCHLQLVLPDLRNS